MAEPAISKIRARTRKRFIPPAAGALLLGLWLLALLPRPGWASFCLAALRPGCWQRLRNLFLPRAFRLAARGNRLRCLLRRSSGFWGHRCRGFYFKGGGLWRSRYFRCVDVGLVKVKVKALWAIGTAAASFFGRVVSFGSGSFVERGHGPVRSLPSSVRCLNMIPRPDTSHGPRYIHFSSDSSGETVDHVRAAWTVTRLSRFPRHWNVYPSSIAVPGGRCPRWAVLTNGYFFIILFL